MHRLFSGCGKQGLLSSCHAQASHWSGSSRCRAWSAGHRGSVVVPGLNCPSACGNLPMPEIEPVSPALGGGFLTTGPPGKSRNFSLNEHWSRGHRTPKTQRGLPSFTWPLLRKTHETGYHLLSSRPDIIYSVPSLCLLVLFFSWPFTAIPREVSCPFSSFHSGQKQKSYHNSKLAFSYLIWNIDEPPSPQFWVEI